MIQFILASGSPRRRELLEQIGINFQIEASHGEEIITKTSPEEIVMELSGQKAVEVADRILQKIPVRQQTVIIGADTLVFFEGQVMGKPKDAADAKRMLSMLQDNVHQVYTGVTLIIVDEQNNERRQIQFYEKTDVEMYPMPEDWMMRYIASREPDDKAGSYAVQGKCAAYIKGIRGEYANVVGLPIARLVQELMKAGIQI